MNEIKKISAKDINEAKERLYEQYESDYQIIGTRTISHPYFFGIFSHETIEVSYVLKEIARDDIPQSRARLAQKNLAPPPVDFAKSKSDILQKATNSLGNVVLNAQITSISKDLKALKEQLENTAKVGATPSQEHPTITKLQDLLASNEFSFGYIQELTARVKKEFSLEDLNDSNKVQAAVVEWIGENITMAKERNWKRPHVVIIIGPTGVGKTTTLVKMAAKYLFDSKDKGIKPSYTFITTDTMRVGAVEQLSKLGDLLKKDVVKAQNNEDVTKLFNEYKSKVDTIFIDTAGYGPNDAEHIASMKTMLSVKGLNADIYLAVTASTKARDLQNILQNYEPFGYQSVIVTKCDESNQFGNVLSVLHEKHKDISFITNGQKITKTISRVNVADILQKLDGFYMNGPHIEEKFGVKQETPPADASSKDSSQKNEENSNIQADNDDNGNEGE